MIAVLFEVWPHPDGRQTYFEHSLVFPADVLMLPIATHDFRQAELLSAHASQLVGALSPKASAVAWRRRRPPPDFKQDCPVG